MSYSTELLREERARLASQLESLKQRENAARLEQLKTLFVSRKFYEVWIRTDKADPNDSRDITTYGIYSSREEATTPGYMQNVDVTRHLVPEEELLAFVDKYRR